MTRLLVGRRFGRFLNKVANPSRPWEYVAEQLLIEDLDLMKCSMESCCIANPRTPETRSIIRRVRLSSCSVSGCFVNGLIIEDSHIENLKKTGRIPLFVWGSVFRHVVICGRIAGGIIVNSCHQMDRFGGIDVSRWEQANLDYYRSCDWALDISKAVFTVMPALRGVPGRLVRRDPETQLLITRERANSTAWRESVDWSKGDRTWCQVTIDQMDLGGTDSTVFVVPKADRKFKELMVTADLMRRSGLAEPD